MSVTKEFKYDIDDEVYIVQETQGFMGAIKCGTCNGDGVLYNSKGISVECPRCNGEKKVNGKYVRLLKPSDEPVKITALMTTVDDNDHTYRNRYYYKWDNGDPSYSTPGFMFVQEEMAFKTLEECTEYCNKYNKKKREIYG